MRANAMLGHLLAAASVAMASGQTLPNNQQNMLDNIVKGLPTGDGKVHRSKVKPDRPGKKTNRYNVSARVRRRHRRS